MDENFEQKIRSQFKEVENNVVRSLAIIGLVELALVLCLITTVTSLFGSGR